jgi:hypothetical protein
MHRRMLRKMMGRNVAIATANSVILAVVRYMRSIFSRWSAILVDDFPASSTRILDKFFVNPTSAIMSPPNLAPHQPSGDRSSWEDHVP